MSIISHKGKCSRTLDLKSFASIWSRRGNSTQHMVMILGWGFLLPFTETFILAVRLGPTLLSAVQRNSPVFCDPTMMTLSVLYTAVFPTFIQVIWAGGLASVTLHSTASSASSSLYCRLATSGSSTTVGRSRSRMPERVVWTWLVVMIMLVCTEYVRIGVTKPMVGGSNHMLSNPCYIIQLIIIIIIYII